MALKINTNVAAINAHRQLLGTEAALNKNTERLSSGYRINSASDDAAGLSIANRLRTNVRSLTVAAQNITEASSMLSTAEGSANQVETILERMKELATQASSANASSDISKLSNEYNTLTTEITRIVGDTKYQGVSLINGTFNGTFQVGSENATTSQINITIGNLSLTSLGVASGNLATAASATTALASIDSAINAVNNVLGDIGATMNRLDYTYSNIQVQIENFSASESAIRDVDMASEMVSYTKNQILLQAGTSMLAQANSQSQNILSLLQ